MQTKTQIFDIVPLKIDSSVVHETCCKRATHKHTHTRTNYTRFEICDYDGPNDANGRSDLTPSYVIMMKKK